MVEEVEENVGRLLEARGHQKSLKKVSASNQAGNCSGRGGSYPLVSLYLNQFISFK